ncbi:Ent-kaurene synthase [Aspergillus niger ATCC 13496]|uniref:Contig An18c0080, genomic contig n=3 Tax=Aspergillus niger TaxID=5061 RepID=A2RAC8_ASPNC|nr:uncharacterized protein An18g02710 [Aspergillus niger]RDH24782.1 Ent-kaurene synthase [Aspergillus niger ATCC 13496]CAK48654.1 unnamed protein product [Aspergillus niger]
MTVVKKIKLSSEPQDVVTRAQHLVTGIAKGCQNQTGFGGFSISLYDTAWLSMVTKKDQNGVQHWLFPESFQYVLRQQGKDGCWGPQVTLLDTILCTMACLLSLLAHRSSPLSDQNGDYQHEAKLLDSRISRAEIALQQALQQWDVASTLQVGSEVLVPSLLQQLSRHGIELQFPGKQDLMKLREKKLAKFQPGMVTSKRQTTLLHSLEGLIGAVEFDELAHHCTEYGGMLGSPASTAAYLIYSSTWDDAAEKYLRRIVGHYGSCGGVPSGFPTPIFETSWVISTLLDNGFQITDFAREDIQTITTYLSQLLTKQQGTLGFAPGFVPDADDTARALLTQALCEIDMDPAPLIHSFEAINHFKTYELERNSSFSANANVLLALLFAPDSARYSAQIRKAMEFMLREWNSGILRDKWNLASEYSEMLFAHALVRFLHVRGQGILSSLPSELAESRVPIALCQLLSRAVRDQSENGSWRGSAERTAYRILLLAHGLKLPWPQDVRQLVLDSIRKGRDYLASHTDDWTDGDYIWIEKVTYKLPILAETYILAAMKIPLDQQHTWTSELLQVFDFPKKKLHAMSLFFSHIPVLRNPSEKTILLAVIEATFYTRRLREHRLDIFPRDNMGLTPDKYLDYIPCAWTCVNIVSGFPLSGTVLWEMMVISLLNYQVDEYMESVVALLDQDQISSLNALIETECSPGLPPIDLDDSGKGCFQCSNKSDNNTPILASAPLKGTIPEVQAVIQKYIRHIRHHPCICRYPVNARKLVLHELRQFLRAHLAHNANNAAMRCSSSGKDGARQGQQHEMYFDWVRTTGATDTSCLYSFAFFCCLISRDSSFCLVSPQQGYLGRALGLHLATMCRQYNDYGSQQRDAEEQNLNSLDFSEFTTQEAEPGALNTRRQREALMEIAEFERACMELSFEKLSNTLDLATSGMIKAFIDVTDLFGQMYVIQDIASRIQPPKSS